MNIVHRYFEGVERARLRQLDGEMGEIIRNGETVMCVFPDNRIVQVEQSALSNKFTQDFVNFMPEQSQYELSIIGRDRMAERPCIILGITAKDSHRYSYRLWLDEEYGLLLKSALRNADGKDLEHFQYTQVEFPVSIEDKELESMISGDLMAHEEVPAVKKDKLWPSQTMWKTSWIPEGYMQINGENQAGDNVMVYNDGLATYSVFIENIKENTMPEGASQVGATVAYVQQYEFGMHKYNVTVIGEIPVMTAMKIAESVEPSMTH